MRLDGEENVVRGEAPSRVELCLEEGPFSVYGGERPPVPKAKEVGLKKRKLSLSMISVRKRGAKRRCSVETAKMEGYLGRKLKRWEQM